MNRKTVAVLAALAAFALPAWADQVVHFTNGTTMAIRTHEVEDDMIRVDLGAGAIMAFPISMVERVVFGGRDVFAGPGYRPSNQALPGREGDGAERVEVARDNTITGEGSLPARYRMGGGELRTRPGGDDSFTAVSSRDGARRPAASSRFQRAGARPQGLTSVPDGAEMLGDQLILSSRPPQRTPNKPEILTFGPPDGGGGGAVATGGTDPTPDATPEPPPESD